MFDRKKFFIIDGHALIYRSYFAFVNNHRANKDGLITSAPFGFVNSLFELFKKENPDYLAVAFDTKYKTWRHEQLVDYKANRPKQPEDITKSFPYIFNILDGFNINKYSLEGFEADDVIGTMTKKIPDDIDVFIMTSRFEGMPMGLIEALSYGIPCLVTKGTNLADEVRSADAGWIAENSVLSIKDALRTIIFTRNFTEKGKNALSLSKTYSWNEIAKQSSSFYKKIIEK